MKIEKIELTKLSADDGKAITKDGETFYKDKYLAPTEDVNEWYEVDEPENSPEPESEPEQPAEQVEQPI